MNNNNYNVKKEYSAKTDTHQKKESEFLVKGHGKDYVDIIERSGSNNKENNNRTRVFFLAD